MVAARTAVEAVSALPVVLGTAPTQGLFVGVKGFVADDTLVFVHDYLLELLVPHQTKILERGRPIWCLFLLTHTQF